MHICIECGKEHDGSYGTGKFCSKHCRYVHIGKNAHKTMLRNNTFKSNLKPHRASYGRWKCPFCGLIFETRAQLNEHKKTEHSAETLKRNQWSNKDYKLSEETKLKLIEASKKSVWDDNRRKRHSEAMKNAVKKHPESYTASNRGRTKQIIVDGIKLHGSWELTFYNYCKDNNIQIEKPTDWFEYEWHGKRKYFPDFFLKEKNLYIEVKGYETERDHAKWSAFPKHLKVIRKDDIMAIRKGSWDLNNLNIF